ncbi:UNVERIFIED_CONTAM: hypothetical protein Slati_4407800 [Sesamum latifolium]|uniref:Retrotransposon gag domain-containing protein n=1 Tax=Sesamum latifolium TaxID=2727402 RepID=A0AAW2SPH2_9LAMI
METPSNATNKQKVVEAPGNAEALQVVAGSSLASTSRVSVLPPLALVPPSPKPTNSLSDPSQHSTSSDNSSRELSPALSGAIQRMISMPIQEQKGLQDVQYQIIGSPAKEQQGVPFTEAVMADELPANCRTPVIAEYDGTTDPQEHLSRFENAALYIDIRMGSNAVFSSPHSLKRLNNVWQKENEPLKEYLQRFNTVAQEVPSTTQEVKVDAFSQGLLDGDSFKSLAKKPISKFDALLARAAKYLNMEDAQVFK